MIRIAIIIIERSDGAFFLHQRRANKRIYPGLYGVGAGGHIEDGESPREGAIRELFEETGVSAPVRPITEFVFPGEDGPYEVHVFHTVAEQIPSPCDLEWQRWDWVTETTLVAHLTAGRLCPDTAVALARLRPEVFATEV